MSWPHDWRRYNARPTSPRRCRCPVCTTDWTRHSAEYKNRVKAEVRAGHRAEPAWVTNRNAAQHRRAAEARTRREARQKAEHSAAIDAAVALRYRLDQLSRGETQITIGQVEYVKARAGASPRLVVEFLIHLPEGDTP